jgi:1-acyl-sn-glycerol-3-phosphate acyltransferase/acyl carrier protein
MARGLAGAGVAQDEAVALFAGECIEYIIACLAIIRAGGAAMPVDVQSDDATLRYVLTDSGCRIILTTTDKVERLRSVTNMTLILLDSEKDDPRGWRHLTDGPEVLPRPEPDDPATLFYTSGTTGRPKGVPLSHANLAFQIKAVAEAGVIGKGDRMALPLPLHHVYPFVIGMLAPLALGLPLIIPHSLTGPQIIRALREGEATIMVGVPRLYGAIYAGVLAKVKARGRLAETIFHALLGLSKGLRRRMGIHVGKRLFFALHAQIAPRLRALARDPLPRTRLGKLRRHLLPGLYDQARGLEKAEENSGARPMPIDEMTGEDIALLENKTARQVWDWLADRYPGHRLTPETSPQLDLGVDSLEWVTLTLEIEQGFGLQLSAEALERIDTVRDFLREVSEAPSSGPGTEPTSFLDAPAQAISESQRRWLTPLNPGLSLVAAALHALNRLAMRVLFRLRVEGAGHLPPAGGFVITPNHTSYLDSSVLGAALDSAGLRRTYWAGWTGVAFTGPLVRAFSRLGRVLPIDPDRGAISSLALGASILQRGDGLIWFPEGGRPINGELQPFRPGIGLLLDRFPAPVVPVYIQGTHEALPPDRKWPRLCRITVAVGAPLEPRQLAHRGAGRNAGERITLVLREQVAELGRKLSS